MTSAQIEAVAQRCRRVCGAVFDLLSNSGVRGETICGLRGLAEEGDFEGALAQAKEYGFHMASVQHGKLVALLVDGWRTAVERLRLEEKRARKRLENLAAEKKTEPTVLAAQRALVDGLARRHSSAKLTFVLLLSLRGIEKKRAAARGEVPGARATRAPVA